MHGIIDRCYLTDNRHINLLVKPWLPGGWAHRSVWSWDLLTKCFCQARVPQNNKTARDGTRTLTFQDCLNKQVFLSNCACSNDPRLTNPPISISELSNPAQRGSHSSSCRTQCFTLGISPHVWQQNKQKTPIHFRCRSLCHTEYQTGCVEKCKKRQWEIFNKWLKWCITLLSALPTECKSSFYCCLCNYVYS
jgi:hypothetical protein